MADKVTVLITRMNLDGEYEDYSFTHEELVKIASLPLGVYAKARKIGQLLTTYYC